MSSRKEYLLDTHRLCDPAQTMERVRPHLSRMGITRIANLTGLDRIGLPTVMVTRPNSRSVAVSLGKGLSLEAAQVSGVMEAIESWHAERIVRPIRRESFAELQAEVAVADVSRLPKVTGASFDPHRRILWVEGRDLGRDAACWVPLEMVDTDYTEPPHGGHGAFPRTTNGLASGNDTTEATCHAICELIERDATTLWHYASGDTRIDPASVDDPRCRDALNRLVGAGLDVGLWDTTSDVGVPSFRCMICEAGDSHGHIGIGDGCHPDRAIALLRAVTEAAQTRLTYISGARDDLDPSEFTTEAVAARGRYVRHLIANAPPARSFLDGPNVTTETFEDDLALLLARLSSAGIDQVVTVDLSRPEFGISVIRAVIPGLEAPHDDPDFIPGPRARAVQAGAA
ncbi:MULTISPECIES: YcaO-like family protein [Roseovarius]|uniref:YcaO-like family protein n=1 Tax=Roseovarius TaxID=74030 RepID=UPI00273DFB04|nr:MULTISPECIES: YcaO-like family protein [unclassified Roseovarius]